MEYGLAVIVLAALVAFVVLRPFVRGVGEDRGDSASREELEAAKEAKYREIRDARLDVEMGKLSQEDFRAIDRELRGDAIEILKRLDALEDRAPEADAKTPQA
jgi:flagellar biosynthesis/type III secretory pathway M-ring protein FliF/YscJ